MFARTEKHIFSYCQRVHNSSKTVGILPTWFCLLCRSLLVCLPAAATLSYASLFSLYLHLCVSISSLCLPLHVSPSLCISMFLCVSLVPPLLHLSTGPSLMSLCMPLCGTGIRLHMLLVLGRHVVATPATFRAALMKAFSVLTFYFSHFELVQNPMD